MGEYLFLLAIIMEYNIYPSKTSIALIYKQFKIIDKNLKFNIIHYHTLTKEG